MFREELAPARDVDLSDPTAAAREEGVSKRQFMANQEEALKACELAATHIKASGVASNLSLRTYIFDLKMTST